MGNPPFTSSRRLCVSGLLACLVLVCAAAGCARDAGKVKSSESQIKLEGTPSPYLFIWAGDLEGGDPDFMAVADVRPGSPRYGQIISSQPVGEKDSMPHHLEYQLPGPGRWLFGNGHFSERIFLFDITKPTSPRVHRVLGPVPPYRYPHDFARLPNGNVLVSFLRSEGPSPRADDKLVPGGHGGIAELDPEGRLVRSSSAAVAGVTDPIRPYAFAVLPDIDRVLTTSAPMLEKFSADVVQVWRLSDLKLLSTLTVPPAYLPNGELMKTRSRSGGVKASGQRLPFEPRVMTDGSVLFNAYGCGFYRVTALDSEAPAIKNVYTIAVPPTLMVGGCSVPVVTGRFWVMPVAYEHKIVVLDISDPAHPTEVASLAADEDVLPHWLSKDPGSNRFILGQEMGNENRMLMLRIDPATGHLEWDRTIKSEDGRLGITFKRKSWPHGATGEATGHAALFQP